MGLITKKLKGGIKIANEQNLIPLTRERAREIGKKGGKANKGVVKWNKKFCKNCKFVCPVRYENIKINKNHKCNIPELFKPLFNATENRESMITALLGQCTKLGLMAKMFKEINNW